MKRFLSLLLCAALVLTLFACAEQSNTPAGEEKPGETGGIDAAEVVPAVPSFTRETLPRLDGSTSTAPLAVAVCAAVLGEGPEEVADLVNFSKTTNAYMHLLSGEAELLIVGEANGDVLAEKERLGFSWEKTPFATDAFVFVVNENNPVDSITVEQARDIYAGRITNWKELGGEDREIVAFQRNQGAGSQTLMEKLVMQGEPMMDAPQEYIVDTMGQLMTAVKQYDDSPGAIGYSVYYYAQEMKMARGLKLLRLEGVAPDPDTIRSETYPLVNPKYVVINAEAAEDAPARILYNWLLSEDGQRMVAREGYVSVMDLTVTPKTTALVGSRRYDTFVDHLLPRDDYGQLVPYAGARLADDWPAFTGCLYGLMTRSGQVVTDAVYAQAYAPAYWEGNTLCRLPLLALGSADAQGNMRYAVAAADGSWCTEPVYRSLNASPEGLTLAGNDEITLLRSDGTVFRKLRREELGMDEAAWQAMLSQAEYGEAAQWHGNYVALGESGEAADGEIRLRCYDLAAGAVCELSGAQWWALWEDVSATPLQREIPENAEAVYDAIFGSAAPMLLRYTEGMACRYCREDGTPLPWQTSYENWYEQVSLQAGLIEVLELNTASYYDLNTLTCVFRTELGFEAE